MPAQQPTCASRVVRSTYFNAGWGTAITPAVNKIVWKIKPEADAMYCLQQSRDRAVGLHSIQYALFWEHRQLSDQTILSTPGADYLDFFTADKSNARQSFETVERTFSDAFDAVLMHPFFAGMRDREFTLWPVECDGVWVVIILRVRAKLELEVSKRSPSRRHEYFDREVTDLAIVDPLPTGRQERANLIETRLPKVLLRASIELTSDVQLRDLSVADCEYDWQTGYVAYAISREVIRRLKVLLFQREFLDTDAPERIFNEFEEHYHIDAYRQLMMAGCAHQTIETSRFHCRLAIEVPSAESKTGYKPAELTYEREQQVQDEVYRSVQRSTGSLRVDIPDGLRNTDEEEITVRGEHSQSPSESQSSDVESDDDMSMEDVPSTEEVSQQEPQSIQSPVVHTTPSPGNHAEDPEPLPQSPVQQQVSRDNSPEEQEREVVQPTQSAQELQEPDRRDRSVAPAPETPIPEAEQHVSRRLGSTHEPLEEHRRTQCATKSVSRACSVTPVDGPPPVSPVNGGSRQPTPETQDETMTDVSDEAKDTVEGNVDSVEASEEEEDDDDDAAARQIEPRQPSAAVPGEDTTDVGDEIQEEDTAPEAAQHGEAKGKVEPDYEPVGTQRSGDFVDDVEIERTPSPDQVEADEVPVPESQVPETRPVSPVAQAPTGPMVVETEIPQGGIPGLGNLPAVPAPSTDPIVHPDAVSPHGKDTQGVVEEEEGSLFGDEEDDPVIPETQAKGDSGRSSPDAQDSQEAHEVQVSSPVDQANNDDVPEGLENDDDDVESKKRSLSDAEESEAKRARFE